MKIIDLRVRTVAIPLNAQLRHNTGVHPGYLLRTVLELITDEDIVGLGEVGGGDQRAALTKLKPRLVGMNPFDLEAIKLKTLRTIYYLSNARLYGAIAVPTGRGSASSSTKRRWPATRRTTKKKATTTPGFTRTRAGRSGTPFRAKCDKHRHFNECRCSLREQASCRGAKSDYPMR